MAQKIGTRLVGLLGAESLRTFNDNLIRAVVILLLIGPLTTEASIQATTARVNIAYTLPWVLLSVPAGLLADRISKRAVLRGLKVAEVLVMGFAAWALGWGGANALLWIIALVGTISAVASPSKYGILPEILPAARLGRGNGALMLWTYTAIITGTALGGLLLDALRPLPQAIGLLLAGLAVWGWRLSARIPEAPAAGRRGGLIETVRQGMQALRANPRLRLGLFGNVGYWGLGALWLQVLVTYAKSSLDASDTRTGLMMTSIAVGIGLGGVSAGFASRGRIPLFFLPLGACGMGAAALAFAHAAPDFGHALLHLLGLGFAAGFFAVPVNALIQEQSPAASRGAVLAVMNVIIFAGIILGSALGSALANLGFPALGIFRISGAATILVALLWTAWGARRLAPEAREVS